MNRRDFLGVCVSGIGVLHRPASAFETGIAASSHSGIAPPRHGPHEVESGVLIHCGDGFFGLPGRLAAGNRGEEVLVHLGEIVAWRNVGAEAHTVTGGPWEDSGVMLPTRSFVWVANQTGLFRYRCRLSGTKMESRIRVIA